MNFRFIHFLKKLIVSVVVFILFHFQSAMAAGLMCQNIFLSIEQNELLSNSHLIPIDIRSLFIQAVEKNLVIVFREQEQILSPYEILKLVESDRLENTSQTLSLVRENEAVAIRHIFRLQKEIQTLSQKTFERPLSQEELARSPIEGMAQLFTDVIKNRLLLYNGMAGEHFTARELYELQASGRFRWGPVNWIKVDPAALINEKMQLLRNWDRQLEQRSAQH